MASGAIVTLINKRFAGLILILLLGIMPATCLADKRIFVVVSSESPVESLSKEQIAAYFLEDNSESNLINTPFDRSDFVLKGRFYRQVAGISLHRLRAYWSKKVFIGEGRPPRVIHPEMIDDTSVFGDRFITYIYEDELTELLKVVYTLEDEPPEEPE